MSGGVGEREAGSVATRSNNGGRRLLVRETRQLPPGTAATAHRLPVVPDFGPVERVQVEQDVRKFRRRENVALYAPLGADEKRLNIGTQLLESARDGESGIQMSAGAAAGKVHPRRARLRRRY